MSNNQYDFTPGIGFTGEDFSQLEALPERLERLRFIDCRFNSQSFLETELRGCVFENCSLDFTRIGDRLSGCAFLNCSFRYANLLGAHFEGCKLTGSDLSEVSNPAYLITGGDWSYTRIKGLTIKKHRLEGVNFTCASLYDCRLEGCELSGVRFDNALIERLSLKNSTLTGASFDNVNFEQIDFRGAKADLDFCVAFAKSKGIKVVF